MGVITVRVPGGAVGLINYSTGTPTSVHRQTVHLTGSRGRLGFEPFGAEMTLETVDGERNIELEESGTGARSMLREFRACVLEDRKPLMLVEEGLKELSAYQSMEQGSQVSVSLQKPACSAG